MAGHAARATLVTVVMLFACVIATFPAEYVDGGIKAADWKEARDSYLSSIKGWLFGNVGTEERRWRLTPFSRALELSDNKTLIDLEKLDNIRRRHKENNDQLSPWETDRTLSLRERNLRGAIFDRSDLRNVDLYDASLQGASLNLA